MLMDEAEPSDEPIDAAAKSAPEGEDIFSGEVTPISELESAQEGGQMHTGLRLSELRLAQHLSVGQTWLLPLHDLKVELLFHYRKVSEIWGRGDIVTLLVGSLAFLFGAWDLNSGELSGGGDIWQVGLSGLNAVVWQSFAMLMVSYGLWVIFIFRLMSEFPLMRGQTFYLLIAWVAVQFGMINSHAGAPGFPIGANMQNSVWFGASFAILGFLSFNTWQAVVQTRDLHVESKHSHPDPRQMIQAMRDHSLIAWSVVLIGWSVLVLVNSWSGAHSVSLRDPSALWPLRILYVLTGVASVFTLLHVLWFPQMMLGGAGEAIESDRAREVSRGLRGEETAVARQRGACPACGEVTAVSRLATGEIEVTCADGSCDGIGRPAARCPACAKVLPSRVACESCGTSAPVIDHLADEDAW
jgi:hypothetical protein